MKLAWLMLTLMILFKPANAQVVIQNNVYLELGGASLFYSANYERLFFKHKERNLTARAGFMYCDFFKNKSRKMTGVPVSFSYLERIGKQFLEIGVSASVISDTYHSPDVQDFVFMPSLRAGVRHQPKDNGLFWNVLFQYSMLRVYNRLGDNRPEVSQMPFGSFGIGYAFR